MSLIASRSLLLAALLGPLLSGCGLVQRTTDASKSLVHAVFYKQVKVLHLDFTGRPALNTDRRDMNGLSVSTLVRVYQLRDRKTLDHASYQDLLGEGSQALAADLLDERRVVVKPEEGAQLNVPLSADAQFVAVVALFRSPDAQQGNWRLVLTRDDLDPDAARVIELGDNAMALLPLPKKGS
ncbi:type VI secretion system lipoprotein TssJ [Pseudomonas nitroreducens]|uniref:type VI secretion system lipoprotein TssJ n=1 Tax=Pseudomonas nitroreducens TaxID=46680 RepID=UPI00209FEF97|nr:type VI secretion system lipoprotein TssJ [Pseudomonas nitroreducens]MCP1626231.1 type VI secretion system protein VasD [Pseudomonas nitroreducens]